ncbi:hypothetical protein PHLGIDRAFT_223071 [Phlebiopsis gigantea 11061_1 CR5-6]|uniref:Uncharacterized protein n=1 Tax=Phlebiopsis gigantea (strain 11061_1 CR5-6) TaxID=745531 RepID=A0A0C3PEH9_PHLG1|nr:hypothetical protein PHLGIDRAFT_223071 [Phlebiopsis gigantea 11061_1 CR5-6]
MSSVIVDDTDLSQLAYTSPPSWVREGAPPEYNSTTHGTGRVGSTVTFTFNGTSVGVFGSVSQSTPTKNITTVSTYQVDGASTVTYTAPVSLTSHLTHQQFFQSAKLQDGQHSLLITVTQADDSAKYWLDYLVYIPGSSTTSSSTPSSPPSASLSSDPAASPSLSPDSSGTSHSGVSGGIIAAAVLVSVSAILLLFVSALWWRKRRARSQALARGQFEVEGEIQARSWLFRQLI